MSLTAAIAIAYGISALLAAGLMRPFFPPADPGDASWFFCGLIWPLCLLVWLGQGVGSMLKRAIKDAVE